MSEYKAELRSWVYNKKSNTVIGNVFGHPNFDDGSLIQTSRLLPMSMQISSPKQGTIVSTLNSKYLLGEKK